jgi:hypothetical protein
MVVGFQGFKFCSISNLSRVFMVAHQPVNQMDYTKVLLLPTPSLGGMDFVPEHELKGQRLAPSNGLEFIPTILASSLLGHRTRLSLASSNGALHYKFILEPISH